MFIEAYHYLNGKHEYSIILDHINKQGHGLILPWRVCVEYPRGHESSSDLVEDQNMDTSASSVGLALRRVALVTLALIDLK